MPVMFVTFAVLKNGTLTRLLHELNMFDMSVTLAVLYKGTYARFAQP